MTAFANSVYSAWHSSGPLVKIKFISHFSSKACCCDYCHSGCLATYCFSTPVSLLQYRSSCAMNVTTAATSSTEGAQALLRPQVTNIPSAFTKTSLWNQIHYVARQITSQRPPTPAQSSHILVLMFFFFLLAPVSNLSGGNWVWKMVVFFKGATGVWVAVYRCVTDNK